jgi:hypothetical protein
MRALITLVLLLVLSVFVAAQDTPIGQSTLSDQAKPGSAPSPTTATSCLIVKHKNLLGRRAVWFALTLVPIAPGSKYDYVDSINFQNTKMAYNGKDLASIQRSGVHVTVLENKYAPTDLDSARKSCVSSARPSEPTTGDYTH